MALNFQYGALDKRFCSMERVKLVNKFVQQLLIKTYILTQNSTPAPPIPEPDYSMSESDDENSVKPKCEPAPPAETSANSNAR